MNYETLIKTATGLKEKGFSNPEIVELIKATREETLSPRIAEKKQLRKTTTEKPTISKKAKERLADYNKWFKSKNNGAYKSQRKRILREYKPNSEVSLKRATYKNGVYSGLQDVTFSTKNGGIVISVEHTKKNFTEEKFLRY